MNFDAVGKARRASTSSSRIITTRHRVGGGGVGCFAHLIYFQAVRHNNDYYNTIYIPLDTFFD
jgi:hypothetical protein